MVSSKNKKENQSQDSIQGGVTPETIHYPKEHGAFSLLKVVRI